jgi:predicted dienelactone hydrolase
MPAPIVNIMVVLAVLLTLATEATAAGVHLIEVPRTPDRPALTGVVWTPCDSAPGAIRLRGRRFAGVRDCPVTGEKRPLIVVSHGRTGWAGGHRDTAQTLADAGFVVAAIDHPIDSNASPTRRVEDIAHLTERTTDIGRLIDFMVGPSPLAEKIDRERIGFFGFSRGGYTGLVLVGARPNGALALAACSGPFTPGTLCAEFRARGFPDTGFHHEPRIKAAVIADPAPIFFFGSDDLTGVKMPVQLWASEHGGRGAAADAIVGIGRMLPTKTDVSIVKGAAHFAFLTPCSAEGVRTEPEQCVDANGFDRAAFHQHFNAEALAFFNRHLTAPSGR